jgi:N-acyl amino acid synthase of PEP-CTERM/exosortase system
MFEGKWANTPELLSEAHRIRYQVYCVEKPFENPAEHLDGRERDEFDSHSVHGLLVHAASNAPVGTVRLVMHKPGARGGSLPIHRLCQHPDVHNPAVLPLATTAESSRFAISKVYRRGTEEGRSLGSCELQDIQSDSTRLIPHITVGLITIALQLAVAHGITHICAMMEPALLRLLCRFGIRFKPLGAQVECHGWRQPCYTTVSKMLSDIERERQDLWEAVTERGVQWPSRLEPIRSSEPELVEFA